jgi:hypothetical protein
LHAQVIAEENHVDILPDSSQILVEIPQVDLDQAIEEIMCLGGFTCQEEKVIVVSEKELARLKKAATEYSN